MSHFEQFFVKIEMSKWSMHKKCRHGQAGRHLYAGRIIKPRRQTTAPSVSSFALTGLTRSSRLTPNHIASAAATNTDE